MQIKERMLNDLQDRFEAMELESQKKPKGPSDDELRRMQNRIRDLESER